MACRRVREIIDSKDGMAFGAWISLSDPAVVEMAAYAGYDYVNIDMEHSGLSLSTVENMIRAASACGISAFVRPPENNAKLVLRVVELGPDGIVIPHLHDAEDARQVVKAAKYAPVGDRGISGSTRAARYNFEPDFLAYTKKINQDLVIYVQIEEMSAVNDIEAIANVAGVDICGIAPADLSRSAGVMGGKNDETVGRAIKHVADTLKRVGKAKFACPFMHPNFLVSISDLKAMGVRMCNYNSDVKALSTGLKDGMTFLRKSA